MSPVAKCPLKYCLAFSIEQIDKYDKLSHARLFIYSLHIFLLAEAVQFTVDFSLPLPAWGRSGLDSEESRVSSVNK